MLKSTSEILQAMGLTAPTVLLDRARAEANIRRMAAKVTRSGAEFRPHFKTHQSEIVGQWFHDLGVRRIAVSSLAMAEQFAAAGWRDIMVAILHNPRENRRAAALASQLDTGGGRLHLVCDDPRVARDISEGSKAPTDVWLKIDTGYGRTGLRWDDQSGTRAVIDACRGATRLRGLLTHCGDSYGARGASAIRGIYDTAITRLQTARKKAGRPDLRISFGDTPCCSVVEDLGACDEIRPGNFVFHDLMQLQIGSCREGDLASAVACPVIGVYPSRREIVLHGGAVHLSKESLVRNDGAKVYGALGTVRDDGLGEVLAEMPVVRLSQEHAVVGFPASCAPQLAELAPGDMVLVWPVHSCLSCDLLRDQMASPLTI